jgi:hypothetical protein
LCFVGSRVSISFIRSGKRCFEPFKDDLLHFLWCPDSLKRGLQLCGVVENRSLAEPDEKFVNNRGRAVGGKVFVNRNGQVCHSGWDP